MESYLCSPAPLHPRPLKTVGAAFSCTVDEETLNRPLVRSVQAWGLSYLCLQIN